MTIIIKDDQGNVVVEKEVSEKDCTVKVMTDRDGQKQYDLIQSECSYH